MLVLRPVEESDLDGVYNLSVKTGGGLTTLPPDRNKLSDKIRGSVKNFHFLPSKPSGETYFFVLEDLEKKQVVGTSAIYSKVGGFQPFWTYKIKKVKKESVALGVSKEVSYLQVKREHNGPSEVGTLFLDQAYRKGTNGRLLSLSRFLFIAEYRELFEKSFVAELRGRIDSEGHSVFWDCLGAHFFDMPFQKADLMVNEDKSFIDELMPKHPIYIDLLPKEAQEVIGMVHDDSRPAMRLLEQEGFKQIEEVDIFEAGPVVQTSTCNIRSVKDSKRLLVKTIKDFDESKESHQQYLVANVKSPLAFRVAVTELKFTKDDKVSLPILVAEALGVVEGSPVRFVKVRAES